MDAQLKAAWIEALRSGKYRQGRFALKDTLWGEARYCCLGVLVAVKDPSQKFTDPNELYVELRGMLDEGKDIPGGNLRHLVKMNDRDQVPFITIADWIEENL